MSTVTKSIFGKLRDGKEIAIYKIESKTGAYITVSELGATIVNLVVPDKDGKLGDIVLGYDTLKEYEDNKDYLKSSYYGATIGRVANRIRAGKFVLGGKEYTLTKNNGNNNLHSAEGCFGYLPFEGKIVEDGVALHRVSPAGEGGFPGNFDITVTIKFSDENVMSLEYDGTTDEDTLVAMTNHSFFNLGGHENGAITEEILKLNSNFFAVADDEVMPVGEIKNVKGTPFDFTEYKRISTDLSADCDQLKFAGGYDHCFLLNKTEPGKFEFAASIKDEKTGRQMDCYTTKPAIHIYGGNFIENGTKGKQGAEYCYRGAICFETEYVPNGMQYPHLGSPVLRKGERYHHKTEYRFTVNK